MQGLVRMACDAQNVDPDNRRKTIRTLARHIEDALDTQRDYGRGACDRIKACCSCFTCSKRFGSYLCFVYLITKILYIGNAIAQFFLLNKFLGTEHTFYGMDILNDLIQGRDWHESGHFPRVTMCDFQIRTLGNLHRYTVQCVLMINLFNEKIFIFLWFWFVIILIINVFNTFVWSLRFMSFARRNFVRKYLLVMRNVHVGEKKTLNTFIDHYLRMDGTFVLRIMALNSGDIIATDTINQLWNNYRNKKPFISTQPDHESVPAEYV